MQRLPAAAGGRQRVTRQAEQRRLEVGAPCGSLRAGTPVSREVDGDTAAGAEEPEPVREYLAGQCRVAGGVATARIDVHSPSSTAPGLQLIDESRKRGVV